MVAMGSISRGSPSAMIAPFPNCFSIADTADWTALSFSLSDMVTLSLSVWCGGGTARA
jgi:hypothetical protein